MSITLRRLQNIRYGINYRCKNNKSPIYHYYGGRGITVCKEWEDDSEDFIQWAIDNKYDDSKEIDRIDNTLGYYPENCRWINKSTNCSNRGIKSTNKSGFIGIAIDKSRKKQPYRVYLRHKGVTLMSKRYKDLDTAVIDRDNFIRQNKLPHTLNLN